MLVFILLHRFKIQFYIKLWLFYKTVVAVVIHVASLTCALWTLTFSLSNLWGWLGYEELSLLEVLEVTCQKPAMIVLSKDCTVLKAHPSASAQENYVGSRSSGTLAHLSQSGSSVEKASTYRRVFPSAYFICCPVEFLNFMVFRGEGHPPWWRTGNCWLLLEQQLRVLPPRPALTVIHPKQSPLSSFPGASWRNLRGQVQYLAVADADIADCPLHTMRHAQ